MVGEWQSSGLVVRCWRACSASTARMTWQSVRCHRLMTSWLVSGRSAPTTPSLRTRWRLEAAWAVARALSLAAIDVLESTGRDLRLSRTEREREGSSFDRFAEHDVVMDRELRRHAAERQIPADESKRTLDTVDPPAWGPAPPDATSLITRCHELRTKPLRDFTAEDLQIMIGQQVALNHLVWPALDRLRSDALVEYDDYPTDLLASLLRVDSAYWERSPDYDQELHILAEGARERFNLAPELRELIETFNRDHSARRIALRARLASGTPDDWWSWPIQQRM